MFLTRFLKPKSEFSRNVLTLVTGTTIAQSIPIAVSPILTRIYSPDDFGVFALYSTLVVLSSVIVTGRYELAIVLPKKDEDAKNIVVLCLLLVLGVSLVLFLFFLLYGDSIGDLLNSPKLSSWLYFAPLSIFCVGIYQTFSYWNNRKSKFELISRSKVLQSSSSAFMNICFGLGAVTNGGLIFANIGAQFFSALYLMKNSVTSAFFKQSKFSNLKILALAKKYAIFPKVNMAHAYINESKHFIFNMLLVKLLNSFLLGQFYLVNRILLMPSNLIGGAVSQALYKMASDKFNNKVDFSEDVLKVIVKLFAMALVPFIIIVLFGSKLFVLVFGEDWAISGTLARSFSLFILFHFIVSPISVVPLIVNKQRAAFNWNLAGCLLYISSFIFGFFIFNDLSLALFTMSCVMAVYFILNIFWVYKISQEVY